jgi:hypothetical protein
MSMSQTVRTTITLLVLCTALVIAAAWGWSAAMKPLPAKVDRPVCVDTSVDKGDKVYPQQVTVSVFNAGGREGLAGRTMQLFKDRGFVNGSSGNAASARVDRVAIWTADPTSPDVRLVASYLGKRTEIERRDGVGTGVTVIVGDKFTDLRKGLPSVVATADARICSPPVD